MDKKTAQQSAELLVMAREKSANFIKRASTLAPDTNTKQRLAKMAFYVVSGKPLIESAKLAGYSADTAELLARQICRGIQKQAFGRWGRGNGPIRQWVRNRRGGMGDGGGGMGGGELPAPAPTPASVPAAAPGAAAGAVGGNTGGGLGNWRSSPAMSAAMQFAGSSSRGSRNTTPLPGAAPAQPAFSAADIETLRPSAPGVSDEDIESLRPSPGPASGMARQVASGGAGGSQIGAGASSAGNFARSMAGGVQRNPAAPPAPAPAAPAPGATAGGPPRPSSFSGYGQQLGGAADAMLARGNQMFDDAMVGGGQMVEDALAKGRGYAQQAQNAGSAAVDQIRQMGGRAWDNAQNIGGQAASHVQKMLPSPASVPLGLTSPGLSRLVSMGRAARNWWDQSGGG